LTHSPSDITLPNLSILKSERERDFANSSDRPNVLGLEKAPIGRKRS